MTIWHRSGPAEAITIASAFALQLTTVRFLGTFLADPLAVPSSVLHTVARQLDVPSTDGIRAVSHRRTTLGPCQQIRTYYGYSDITDPGWVSG